MKILHFLKPLRHHKWSQMQFQQYQLWFYLDSTLVFKHKWHPQHRKTKLYRIWVYKAVLIFIAIFAGVLISTLIFVFGDHYINEQRTAETLLSLLCNSYNPIICIYYQLSIKSEWLLGRALDYLDFCLVMHVWITINFRKI